MKMHFHAVNGGSCWRCAGTVYDYIVDEYVTFVAATCTACRSDNMFFPPKHCATDTAANVSAAHRESQGTSSDGTSDYNDMARKAKPRATFSVTATPGDWRTNETRFKLVAYPTGRASFPTESNESWATREEAEAVCRRVNLGDEAGVSFACYADD